MSDNLTLAVTYAHAGWKTFPCWWTDSGQCACRMGSACKSPGKHPLCGPAHPADSPERATCRGECGRAGHGLYDATDDIDTLTRWWTRYPAAHIGLPADGNGLAILDVDPVHGGAASLDRLKTYLDRKRQPLPDTLTVITGSGGTHHYYAAPDGGVKGGANVFGTDMPGLDVRGRGHYVIAPPSGHATGGTYRWVDFFTDLPPWPAILTRIIDPPRPQTTYTGPAKPPSDKYAAAALERETALVAAAGEGTRNDTLNEAAFSLGTLVGAGILDEMQARRELAAAARAAGLGERELTSTILSGLRAGKDKPRAVPT